MYNQAPMMHSPTASERKSSFNTSFNQKKISFKEPIDLKIPNAELIQSQVFSHRSKQGFLP